MRVRRTIWLFGLGVTVLVAMTLALFLCTGRITRPMVTDYGYFRWTRGLAPLQPKYLLTFTRDYRFREGFVGSPIESLKPLFPKLHSGAHYDPGSYRATNVRTFFSQYSGTRFEDYWLDGTQQDFGFCVLVVDGKIRDFFFVKG